MPWKYIENATRETLTAEILKPDGILKGRTCQHKLVGATLWIVREFEDHRRAIICAMLHCQYGHGYGYRLVSESYGPEILTCPQSFFELAPHGCEDWREKVRAWQHQQGRILCLSRGDILTLPTPYIPRLLKLLDPAPRGAWEACDSAGNRWLVCRHLLDTAEITKKSDLYA